MPSARRKGAVEDISTLKASGGDYTDPAVWESDTDIVLSDTKVLECDAGTYDVVVNLSGATTSASNFRIIRPATGQFHDGTPDTGVIFSSTAVGYVAQINEDHSSIQDITATFAHSDAVTYACFLIGATFTNADIVGCIVDTPVNSGAGGSHGFRIEAGTVRDCLAIAVQNQGLFGITGASAWENCASIDSTANNFYNHNTTVTVKNCYGDNATTQDFNDNLGSGTWAGNNNASSDTTAPGTSNRVSQTFTYVNAAGKDYHLASNDAGAKGFGADLSASFNDDIDRQQISEWSIGPDCIPLPAAAHAGLYQRLQERRRRFEC